MQGKAGEATATTHGEKEMAKEEARAKLCYTYTDTCIEADTDTAIRHFPKKPRYVDTFQNFFNK